jgi:hypothetical protein
MITMQESEKAKGWIKKQSNWLKHHADYQPEEFAAFLKHVHNTLERVNPETARKIPLLTEDIPSKEKLTQLFEMLFETIVEIGNESSYIKTYKTSDVAKFFGVTIATVNNWIKENRIKGVIKKDKFSHAIIPETAVYITHSNEPITIGEVAEMYHKEMKERLANSTENDEMLESLKFFKEKYGGSYFETLAKKKRLTPEEQRDAAEWTYILKRLDLFHE